MLNFFLLDAAQGTIILFPLFILHFVLTILIEAYFLKRFSTETYKKSLLYSFEMNIASLVAGILVLGFITEMLNHLGSNAYSPIIISILFILTLLIEFLVIRLVKRNYETRSLIKALLFGNLITYAILIGILLIL